jgi:hypothetical protein
LLGHADAALKDVADAIRDAREIGHAATLTYALLFTWFTQVFCGNYSAAAAQADEVVRLADEKNSMLWRACGTALPRQRSGSDWKSIGRGENHYDRYQCVAFG